jgi:fructuronate reductase
VTAAPQVWAATAPRARLDDRCLAALPAGIRRPTYDRARLEPGIVHIGIGAFHRAHQAVYIDDFLHKQFGPWGIVGISLRHGAVRDALEPQGGLYTLVERESSHIDYRVIGSVVSVLLATQDPEAVLRRLTVPATSLVTVTVTEKGYCLAPGGRLDPDHPEIRRDLEARHAPRSAIGFLVEALRRIRAAGTAPPSILSCDNLPSNGRTLHRALVDFAALRSDDLAGWIEGTVAVPSTMVDRIVPATTDADMAEVKTALAIEDRGPVVGEPFRQWVVENRLGHGFPNLAEAGVEIVADVAPHERMKLRMLNGCHSSIAYLGQLAGHEFVADAMDDRSLRRFLERMMAEEVAPTLLEFSGQRLAGYAAQLIRRFENRAIRHRTRQIAMDGSQKLPQRLLGTVEDRLRKHASIARLALAVAAWVRFLGGKDDRGRAIEVSDPRARELTAWAEMSQSDDEIVANLVDRSGIFPAAVQQSEIFRRELVQAVALLRGVGVREALKRPAYGGT